MITKYHYSPVFHGKQQTQKTHGWDSFKEEQKKSFAVYKVEEKKPLKSSWENN